MEARRANYDGEDYGNGVDEYHDEEAFRAVEVMESQEQIKQSTLHGKQARESYEQYQQAPRGQWPPHDREETNRTYTYPELQPAPLNPRHPPPTIDITSPTPDPTQHHRSFSDPEIAMPQPPFSDQPEVVPTYDDGYDAPPERTLTVGEMRRRRRKAMQAMMSRQSSI